MSAPQNEAERLALYDRLCTALRKRPGESLQAAALREYRNRGPLDYAAIPLLGSGEGWEALVEADRRMREAHR